MMRSIYITNFYNNNRSLKSKQELALQMRHSVFTGEKNYYKITSEIPKETNKELENENDDLKNWIERLVCQIKAKGEDPVEFIRWSSKTRPRTQE